MEPLRILLLGNGGREHALAWKLSQSKLVEIIYVVPGNGGTASDGGKIVNVANVNVEDFPALMLFAKGQAINLIVPGPEAPLVAGIESACRHAGIRCFGPIIKAARMEGSKTFAKAFMLRHGIPTAKFGSFSSYDAALSYLQNEAPERVVIKASGLAAGKGVIIPSTKEEAISTLKDIMLDKAFGSAGDEVVIEEFLEGEELSILSFCDGYTIRSLPPAQDHKQIYDGDKGPMTGGMGCYAPIEIATTELVDKIHETILRPTIDGMRKERFPFVGILFTGLMLTSTGPKVLEYNARSGDPETETLLPLLSPSTDLAEIMIACTDRYLDAVTLEIEPKYSATVIAVAGGYPGKYTKGDPITLPTSLPPNSDGSTIIFHAGTTLHPPSSPDSLEPPKLLTSGGRVLAITSTSSTLSSALSSAYSTLSNISSPSIFYRRDIGHRDLSRPSISSSSTIPRSSSSNPSQTTPLTYASTGVSLSSASTLITRLKPIVSSTSRPGSSATIGGFGGTFSLPLAGYPSTSPTLIAAIDGVGTKLLLAQKLQNHSTVGIDLVAMNVNDLLVQGAEPLLFLDCFSCGKLDVEVAAAFVKSVVRGCVEAGCALVGGETAELPGLFKERIEGEEGSEVYDAVGAAVGAVKMGERILPCKERMRTGDVLVGLESSGVHSNGFSLVRKVVEKVGVGLGDGCPWLSSGGDREGEGGRRTVGEELLTPTRIYVRSVLKALRAFNGGGEEGEEETMVVKGLAHITGGGLVENVPRALPKHLRAKVDARKWRLPAVFRWLKEKGRIDDVEMARVWNCGVGIVIVVQKEKVGELMALLEGEGEKCSVIGELLERKEGEEGCVVEGTEEAWRMV